MKTDVLNSKLLRLAGVLTTVLALVLIEVAIYMVFLVVPTERVMGAVQRIFYFHVGSALASYVAFGIVFIASLAVLATRKKILDCVNVAAAEVGFLFCSITLVTGIIWAKVAWNTWFRWEPRLVTFLLLWTIFAGFLILRRFGDESKMEIHSAILGILGASMVPVVWLSVYLMPQIAQLHPKVVEKGGLKDSSYVLCFELSVIALILLAFALIWLRTRLEVVVVRQQSLVGDGNG